MAKKGPIRPEDVAGQKGKVFPDEVFEAFNELIASNFVGNSATVKQSDVVALMVQKGLKRSEIFEKGWLNVEEVYESAGWHVSYDKPGFNESYPATFTFKHSLR